ncbi:MAG TPA: hypothetical protein DCE42_28730 [Myxococcales bacterium]|nr:hypothetical protein [Deltaproteobacteria bacterium]MBU54463.1 hypothetical protein [Deltaproteobacteria bacterium]HAA58782.1 hypothetical protein [Myxococcales bacterium]|tara:strand:- start:2513 stop:3178 length:666 start_codon:yes stop_codon:yes gene_type:complete
MKLRAILFIATLGLFVWGAQGEAEASACQALATKTCQVFGSSSFHCKAYILVAKHKGASNQRCGAYLARWKVLARIIKRKENYLNQMESLAQRHGANAIAQVSSYKQKMLKETLAEMTHGRRTAHDPAACKKLVKLVCKELGQKSMYCAIFTKAQSIKGVQAGRCQLLLRNWAIVQRRYYHTQETRIRNMMKQAKTKGARQRVALMRLQEYKRLVKFLTRK